MKQNIVLRFFAAIWRGLNGLRKVLHLLLLLLIFMLFFGALSGEAPQLLPQRAALVIQPVGALVEQLAGNPYDRALAELTDDGEPQVLVQDIVDALEAAGSDNHIAAVHFDLTYLGAAGLDKLQRVGNAIDAFRESGKPVIASADFYTQQGYFLAAHADEVYMNPDGLVLLQGYGSYRNYFRDAIDLLRIDWNVFRVGTHKSYAEPYMRMDMSPEDRASRQRIVDYLWDAYQVDVIKARGLPDNAIHDYADNLVAYTESAGGDMALVARDRGLVDELVGRNALADIMIGHVGTADDDDSRYAAISLKAYLQHLRLRPGNDGQDANVAVIVASGNILDGTQAPGSIGGDSTAALLRRARNDESVEAVVLRVDSGGGSKFASEVIAEEIMALQDAGKPVVASMGSVAASGGYWISMPADKVFANKTTITGSIGIVGMFPTFQRTMATVGIANDGVGTTPWSGQLRPDREMSEDAKRIFQIFINDGYEDFVATVADHRDLDESYVDQIGQGQIWSGEEARDNGLVDEIGDIDAAIASAAELAGLDSYGQKLIEQELSPTEQMILDMLSVVRQVGLDPAVLVREPTPIETFANRFQELLARVAQFNDPQGMYAHCFCEIT